MHNDAVNLAHALDWLASIVEGCLRVHTGKLERFEAPALEYRDDDSWLSRFMQRQNPTSQEFAVLMLALAPHLDPSLLGKLIATHLPEGGEFMEFGGVKGASHRGILPTGETAQFVVAGADLGKRLTVQRILGNDHWFARHRMLWLEPVRTGEPAMSGRLVLDPEVIEQMTLGTVSRPLFSTEFPAEYIETKMD